MAFPTRLLLLRHGEVEERYHRVFGGRIDMQLSPRGHDQAGALARWLERLPIDALYASPLRRAQQTLAPLATRCSKPPTVKSEFREVDFGDWTGLTWEEVYQRYQIRAFDWLDAIERGAIANAEDGAALRSRIGPSLWQIVGDHAGQTVAIVCHGGVIRVMLSLLLNLPLPSTGSFEIEYASVTRVEKHSHKTELTLLNLVPWRDCA
jgi:broad specificity phosphatase PhoE